MWKRILRRIVGRVLVEVLPTVIESITSSIQRGKDPIDVNRIAEQALRDSLDIK